jgi:hypothetical protein
MTEKTTANEQRQLERREEKAHGRSRRADLLLDTQAKEKARADLLEGRQDQVEAKLADHEQRIAALEKLVASSQTPAARAPTTTPPQ